MEEGAAAGSSSGAAAAQGHGAAVSSESGGTNLIKLAFEEIHSNYTGLPRLLRLLSVANQGLPTKRKSANASFGSKRSRIGGRGVDRALDNFLSTPNLYMPQRDGGDAHTNSGQPMEIESNQDGESSKESRAQISLASTQATATPALPTPPSSDIKIVSLDAARECLKLIREEGRLGLMEKVQECTKTLLNSEKLPQCDAKDMLRAELSLSQGEWLAQAKSESDATVKSMRTDLANAKSTMIKESIRECHLVLGDVLLKQGDLAAAVKSYVSARDYCTTTKHHLQMCTNVIRASLYLEHYGHIDSYASKAMDKIKQAEKQKDSSVNGSALDSARAQVKCGRALSMLTGRNFRAAARHFVEIPSSAASSVSEMINPEDVALYGSVCILAAYSRQEMKAVLDNEQSFREYLELSNPAREMLSSFVNYNYDACFKCLKELEARFKLDMYIGPHATVLYKRIRDGALVQYVKPHISVDLTKMAACFQTTFEGLCEELVELISKGDLKARINIAERLRARRLDARLACLKGWVEIGNIFVALT